MKIFIFLDLDEEMTSFSSIFTATKQRVMIWWLQRKCWKRKEKSKREYQVLSGSYSCVLFCETMKDRKHEFLTFSLVLTPLVAEASKEKETNKTIKILKYFSMHRTCNMVVQSSPRQRKTQEKPKEPAFGNGQSPRHKKHVFQFCII